MKYLYYFCLFIFFIVAIPEQLFASGEILKITEIMYDLDGTDTDREWIEVYNSSSQVIDMSGWKFFDGSNHVLNEPPTNGGIGSLQIPAGGYAIIAQNAATFLSEHAGYIGTVIDSVLSLSNTGDTLKIVDSNGQIIDEVSYTSAIGANGDGNSLSWYQNGWVSVTPSPGTYSQIDTAPGTSVSSTVNTSSVKPVSFADSQKEPTWGVTLTPSMKSLFSHVPFALNTQVVTPGKEVRRTGKFVYNLGDGRVIEKTTNEVFELEYPDSGTYIIYFEYYFNAYEVRPQISERFLVAVEDVPVILSVVEQPQYKVSILNLHASDVDVSEWILSNGVHSMTFPMHTFLPAKKEVTIRTEGFALSGKHLTFQTKSGFVVATFPGSFNKIENKNLVSSTTNQAIRGAVNVSPLATASSHVNTLFSDVKDLSHTEKTYDIKTKGNESLQATPVHSLFGINQWVLLFGFLTSISSILIFIFLQQKKETNENQSLTSSEMYTIVEE